MEDAVTGVGIGICKYNKNIIKTHPYITVTSLEGYGVSNHQQLNSVCSTGFIQLSSTTKTHLRSALLALCEVNPPVAGGFPSQRANNVESVSMSWRHRGSCENNISYNEKRLHIWQFHSLSDTDHMCLETINRKWALILRLDGFMRSYVKWLMKHKSNVAWTPWRLQCPTTRLFVQQILRANNKENTKPSILLFLYKNPGFSSHLFTLR